MANLPIDYAANATVRTASLAKLYEFAFESMYETTR
jgi:hypothetical protein